MGCGFLFYLYEVSKNLEAYQDAMKYFKVQLTPDKKLIKPIITKYASDSYVALYRDKQLLAQHKADYLLSRESWFGFRGGSWGHGGCLIIDKLIPSNLRLIPEAFFRATSAALADLDHATHGAPTENLATAFSRRS